MRRDFDILLDKCIDRMNAGESIEMCLASYPGHARELEPLLRTVGGVRDACSAIPGVAAKSAARRRLNAAVANSARRLRRPQRRSRSLFGWSRVSRVWTKIREEIDMKLPRYKWGIMATATALILVLVGAHLFLAAPQAVAHLTMQVNPALRMSLDEEHRVIGVAGLDEEGKALLAHLDIQNMELQQALRTITDVFKDAGFLRPEARLVIVLHPVGDRKVEALPDLAIVAQETVTRRLAEVDVQIEVVSHAISEELYETAIGKGLLPSAFADLMKADVSEDSIKSIMELGNELGIEQELFREEFSTLASAVADMAEAGITEVAAADVIREALQADPSLEEVSTIAADIVDMHEAGLTPEHSLALLTLHRDLEVLGVTEEAFLEEFSTLTSAMIDMAEAGITEAAAADVIREALRIDPSLEEVSTIAAHMIDLIEVGIPEADALARVEAAILEVLEGELTLEIVGEMIPGETVTLAVSFEGEAVAGALVTVNDEVIGVTDDYGKFSFMVPEYEELEIEVVKGGLEGELEIVLEGELTLEIVGEMIPGETVTLAVSFEGEAVAGALVTANDEEIGVTDEYGKFSFMVPHYEELEIKVVKGGLEGELEIVLEEEILEGELTLEIVGEVIPGESVTLVVTFEEEPVAGALVTVNDEEIGATDEYGKFSFIVPEYEEIEIKVVKGGLEGELEIDLEREVLEGELSLEVVGEVIPGGTVILAVSFEGETVAGAVVTVNDEEIGVTDEYGNISLIVPQYEELEIEVVKGALEGELEIVLEEEVLEGELTLEIVGEVIPGESVTLVVTFEEEPVAGALVTVNDEEIGATDEYGKFSFMVPQYEELEIEVVKGGLEGELEIVLEEEILEGELTLEIVGDIIPGATVTLAVTLEGEAVAGALVTVNDVEIGATDEYGKFSFMVPEYEELEIKVVKGGLEGELTIVLEEEAPEGELTLEIVGEVIPGATVTLAVSFEGEPVAGALVTANDEEIGVTDEAGNIFLTLPEYGEVEIKVVKGALEGELEIVLEEEVLEGELTLEIIGKELPGATVTLAVSFEGEPVAGALVTVNDEEIGATDEYGNIALILPQYGEIEIKVVKGALEGELEIVLEEEVLEGELGLEIVGEVIPGGTVTLAVSFEEETVVGAVVTVNDEEIGATDEAGDIDLTLPEYGELEIKVVKGALEGELTIVLEEEVLEGELTLGIVGEVLPGATVTLAVSFEGEPVAGALVTVNDEEIGATDEAGNIDLTLPEYGELEIKGVKGDLAGELTIVLEEEVLEGELTLEIVGEVLPGATVTLAVSFEGDPIAGALVTANDEEIGVTDEAGNIDLTLPEYREVEIKVVKGALEGELTIVLEEEVPEGELTLEIVGEVIPGATVTLAVSFEGEPVAGALVTANDEEIGVTDEAGNISLTLPEYGEVEIKVVKEGLEGELTLNVE